MNSCNIVKRVLKFTFMRFIVFPVVVLMSPMLFIFSEGNCEQGKEEVKDLLKFAWDEAKK